MMKRFTYADSTYVFEGAWDSGTEMAQFNFPYIELEPHREVHFGPRRAGLLKQKLPEVRVEFLTLDEPVVTQTDPDELLLPQRKLCIVSNPLVVLFDGDHYDYVLGNAHHMHLSPPTREEFYATKVIHELTLMAGAIKNIYIGSMERLAPSSDIDPTV